MANKKIKDKEFDKFLGYGDDATVVLEQKPFTIEDLQDSFEKMAQYSQAPSPIQLPPTTLDEFRKLFDPDYHKKYYAKCTKFEALFHKGVVFEHRGSKIRWQVIKTFKHTGTGEIRCRIKSLTSKATKELNNSMFNDYWLIDAPDAVKVLFGAKDE